MRIFTRWAAAVGTAALLVSGIAATPAVAAPMSAQFSSGELSATFQVLDANRAWDTRNNLRHQAEALRDPNLVRAAQNSVDQVVEFFFPGLIAQRTAQAAAPAPAAAAPAPAVQRPRISSPCPSSARACVDLQGGRTWLQRDGEVEYGPVRMSAGAPGPETETPKGLHLVNRKVKDEVSRPFDDAPMPFSVYFTYTGVAFHQGDVRLLSHGCIHLTRKDAQAYFDALNVGDQVFVY